MWRKRCVSWTLTPSLYEWADEACSLTPCIEFLAPNALDFVQTSLGSKFNESLGPAGPWADEIKSNHAYDWYVHHPSLELMNISYLDEL